MYNLPPSYFNRSQINGGGRGGGFRLRTRFSVFCFWMMRKPGRSLPPEVYEEIVDLYNAGYSMNEISRTTPVTRRSVLLSGARILGLLLNHQWIYILQETERPKGKAKLSKPLEKMYLVLPFSLNLLRSEAETNLFASLLTSHTLSSISSQSRNTFKFRFWRSPRPSSTGLKSSFEKLTPQKKSWMKFARFAQTFCWNIGTFGANLCELFPELRIRHSKIGQETLTL